MKRVLHLEIVSLTCIKCQSLACSESFFTILQNQRPFAARRTFRRWTLTESVARSYLLANLSQPIREASLTYLVSVQSENAGLVASNEAVQPQDAEGRRKP